MIDHFPKQAGVYAIRHVGSGKVYIGSAQNLWRRGRDHVRMLRGGYHPNPHLQRAVLVLV
jgi:predicted GIY-YIG superfamily endonuclease